MDSLTGPEPASQRAGVRCPNCGGPVGPPNLFPAFRRASCPACLNIFPIDEAAAAAHTPPPGARPAVRLPPRFRLEPGEGRLGVSWPWLGARGLALLPAALFWDGLTAFWLFRLATGSAAGDPLFMLIPGAIGAALTYLCLAGLLNRTRLEVAGGRLRLGHGPLPWPGRRDIPADQIRQLYAAVRKKAPDERRGPRAYELHAILADQRQILLLGGLAAPEQALYLEQQIEQALGIADRRVEGELRR